MSTETFEKTNWGWEFSLFQQQTGEWLEYQFSRLQNTLPELPGGWSINPGVVEFLKILFWVILGLFVSWVGWRLWREFSPYIYSWLSGVGNFSVTGEKNRSRESSIAFLLNQGQEFSRQGNYHQACRCLYLAMLQHLDEKAIALQQASRTDGEYLQLLKSAVRFIQPYETLITTHEQLCFRNAEMSAENYQQCWQAYQELFKG